jgi:hypothetical protein
MVGLLRRASSCAHQWESLGRPCDSTEGRGKSPTTTSTAAIRHGSVTSTPAVRIDVDPRRSIPLDECLSDRMGLPLCSTCE